MTFNIAPYNTSAVVGENGTLACIVTLAQGENVQWKKVCNGIATSTHTLDATGLELKFLNS